MKVDEAYEVHDQRNVEHKLGGIGAVLPPINGHFFLMSNNGIHLDWLVPDEDGRLEDRYDEQGMIVLHTDEGSITLVPLELRNLTRIPGIDPDELPALESDEALRRYFFQSIMEMGL